MMISFTSYQVLRGRGISLTEAPYPPFTGTIHLSSNTLLSFAQPLLSSRNTPMNTFGDFCLPTFGDATGAISAASSPTTPSESPICSPLIFPSTFLPVDLPEFTETPLTSSIGPEPPAQDKEVSLSSPCLPESMPSDHTLLDTFETTELFYTPQGIGEDAPLEGSTSLLLQPNTSISPLDGVDPTSAAHPTPKGIEFSDFTACSLAHVGSPINPSIASVILSSGDTAQAAYSSFFRSQRSTIKVLSMIHSNILQRLLTSNFQ